MIAAPLRTVLVIDDEIGPRESIRFLLKDAYKVICAAGVDEGVACLRERTPDLVIMDIRMPGKSGIEGLREVRELDSEVSVVMLTGYGALETAQEALRLGATDYLSKPFDASEMRLAVRRYVARTIMERQRRDMLRELSDINRRLVSDMAEKEQVASVAQASAEIAHDMRNPLMIVSGYVELLTEQLSKVSNAMQEPEVEQVHAYLDVISQNVKRCCDLSHMWQKYGKVGLTEFDPLSMQDLLRDVMAGAEPLAATENVTMHYDVSAGHAVVVGSRAQLIRAVHNVVANAIQAIEGGDGEVRVSCLDAPAESAVDIVVEDNGCGMAPDVLDRIFEPYFTTKHTRNGTGLGMAITKRIVEEHHGSLLIDSTPGEGTRMTLRLPVAVSKSAVSAQASCGV